MGPERKTKCNLAQVGDKHLKTADVSQTLTVMVLKWNLFNHILSHI